MSLEKHITIVFKKIPEEHLIWSSIDSMILVVCKLWKPDINLYQGQNIMFDNIQVDTQNNGVKLKTKKLDEV